MARVTGQLLLFDGCGLPRADVIDPGGGLCRDCGLGVRLAAWRTCGTCFRINRRRHLHDVHLQVAA